MREGKGIWQEKKRKTEDKKVRKRETKKDEDKKHTAKDRKVEWERGRMAERCHALTFLMKEGLS